MTVKVRKLDNNGHDDGEDTHNEEAHISAPDGILSVRGQSPYEGKGGDIIAIYQKGFWISAEVS